MFYYHLRIATLSIRRNPIISALMVAAIGVGICTCMSILTIRHQMVGDPIPQKSDRLFAIQIDSRLAESSTALNQSDIPFWLSYRDATNLMAMTADSPAKNQVIMTRAPLYALTPNNGHNKNQVAQRLQARATYASFFAMFEVPFLYGGAWSRNDDDNARQVVVLSRKTNEKLFAGKNSIGKTVVLADQVERYYQVVGVLDHWNPMPKFFDPGTNFTEEDVYIPFNIVPKFEIARNVPMVCLQSPPDNSYQGILNSECNWVVAWAELENAQQAKAYLAFLDHYTETQKSLGRLPQPTNNIITPADDWIHLFNKGRSRSGNMLRLFSTIGFLFLFICLINTTGLLLAKFLSKAGELSLKRALGASKSIIFKQCVIEVSLIGFIGGLLGIGLTWISLRGIQALLISTNAPAVMSQYLTHMDWQMILLTVGLAITASTLAGLLPAWRACKLPPAQLLRAQ